ncbi:unnamed protein product [Sphagnum tenellum]
MELAAPGQAASNIIDRCGEREREREKGGRRKALSTMQQQGSTREQMEMLTRSSLLPPPPTPNAGWRNRSTLCFLPEHEPQPPEQQQQEKGTLRAQQQQEQQEQRGRLPFGEGARARGAVSASSHGARESAAREPIDAAAAETGVAAAGWGEDGRRMRVKNRGAQ